MDGEYKVISFKRASKGYISITDRESGQEIGRTPVAKGNPDIYNGYNASYRIFSKIDKNNLLTELKKRLKKEVITKIAGELRRSHPLVISPGSESSANSERTY